MAEISFGGNGKLMQGAVGDSSEEFYEVSVRQGAALLQIATEVFKVCFVLAWMHPALKRGHSEYQQAVGAKAPKNHCVQSGRSCFGGGVFYRNG